MTCLKRIEKVCAVLAFVGFMILVGVAGHGDYMDEIREYYPAGAMLKDCIPGILLMMPSLILELVEERWCIEDDNDSE
jgi:hypothetical protein